MRRIILTAVFLALAAPVAAQTRANPARMMQFDGERMTRAAATRLLAGEGFSYLAHDLCRGAQCDGTAPLAGLTPRGAAVLTLTGASPTKGQIAWVLTEQTCDIGVRRTVASHLRPALTPANPRMIDCFAGYKVLYRNRIANTYAVSGRAFELTLQQAAQRPVMGRWETMAVIWAHNWQTAPDGSGGQQAGGTVAVANAAGRTLFRNGWSGVAAASAPDSDGAALTDTQCAAYADARAVYPRLAGSATRTLCQALRQPGAVEPTGGIALAVSVGGVSAADGSPSPDPCTTFDIVSDASVAALHAHLLDQCVAAPDDAATGGGDAAIKVPTVLPEFAVIAVDPAEGNANN